MRKTKTKIDKNVVFALILMAASLITIVCVISYRAGRRHAIETARLTGQYKNTYVIAFEDEEHFYVGD